MEPVKITAKIPYGGTPTANGRSYTPEALERAVKDMNERAAQGRLLGQLDTPYDGKTRLQDISHKILPDAELNEDGSMSVSIEVLDTPMGRQLKAMLEHSPNRVQVSSRANIRGISGGPDDLKITSVDFDFNFPSDWTVLDGIVDSLENEDKKD